MKITFVTLFPKYFEQFIGESIIKKAIERKIIEIDVVDIREYSNNKHNKVDDEVYGGGAGMLLKVGPVDRAIKNLDGKKILLSPQGKKYNQKMAYDLSKEKHIVLVSGRYEGFDERVVDLVDDEISIGDYVLTGGEVPSMVLADSIIRLVPGVIKEESHQNDSFSDGLLDYPQYTRPRDYNGMKVPEVLLNGNHKEIEKWRKQKKFEKTKRNRPDLLERK
ncbi:MAG: tRNA (guanosine(37)-N1)-methyltransferase TrmD [Mycoplasma sp.]|nr:tRNA (guanosine(37)-N1)-methyltransferase TrmD [Mycoplasma sp.]